MESFRAEKSIVSSVSAEGVVAAASIIGVTDDDTGSASSSTGFDGGLGSAAAAGPRRGMFGRGGGALDVLGGTGSEVLS
jgi:hypothetical protein